MNEEVRAVPVGPKCEKCGTETTRKEMVTQYGPYAFWGCPNYHQCGQKGKKIPLTPSDKARIEKEQETKDNPKGNFRPKTVAGKSNAPDVDWDAKEKRMVRMNVLNRGMEAVIHANAAGTLTGMDLLDQAINVARVGEKYIYEG